LTWSPPARRATAYGVYAGILGAAPARGALTGILSDNSVPVLVMTGRRGRRRRVPPNGRSTQLIDELR
jgi:hypothetical protein